MDLPVHKISDGGTPLNICPCALVWLQSPFFLGKNASVLSPSIPPAWEIAMLTVDED